MQTTDQGVTIEDWLQELRFGNTRKINDAMQRGPGTACAMGVLWSLEKQRYGNGHIQSGRIVDFLRWRRQQGKVEVETMNDFVYRGDRHFARLADDLEADYIEFKAQRDG